MSRSSRHHLISWGTKEGVLPPRSFTSRSPELPAIVLPLASAEQALAPEQVLIEPEVIAPVVAEEAVAYHAPVKTPQDNAVLAVPPIQVAAAEDTPTDLTGLSVAADPAVVLKRRGRRAKGTTPPATDLTAPATESDIKTSFNFKTDSDD